MSHLYESKTNFILGLSDLWTKFFKDDDQLKAMYTGNEILIGQAYLELVSTVLNISARETPVFQKEFFKLLTVREDNIVYRVKDGRYGFEVTDIGLKDSTFLYNKIFGPSTILEKHQHFEYDSSTDEDYLVFYNDPFDWLGDGEPIPGMASRVVEVADADGVVTEQRELAIWVPDAVIEQFDMYLNYGYLINRFEPSSEAYRSLIQGVIQYFVLGPTPQYLLSALNVVIGLPVIREDGEILQEVTTANGLNTVVTDKNQYAFDEGIPLRTDVTNTANWGTLTLDSLEHLSTVFFVRDSISEPTWWMDSIIPQKLLPDEPRVRRIINPDLYDNVINNPVGLTKIGDPGFYVGADDDGFVPSGRPPLRHLFSFIVFERYLKTHAFYIGFDSQILFSDLIPFPRLDLDIQQVILAGKSAYTILYAEPGLQFEDSVQLSAELESVNVGMTPSETMVSAAIHNSLTVSAKSWKIGDYYYYSGGSMVVKNESTDPIGTRFQDGKTPVAIGGTDPTHMERKLASGTGDFNGSTLDVGVALFDSTDQGRWVRKGTTGNTYHQIVAVIDQQTVLLSGALYPPSSDDWELYVVDDGHEVPGFFDWGVQIRVY